MKLPERLVLVTVLGSLLVGAGAGVVASVLTSQALDNYANNLLGGQGFSAFEPRKPNTNPLNYDEALKKARETENRSLAVITPKSTDTVAPAAWIGGGDSAGLGVIVSANGWVLTTSGQLATFTNPITGAEVWIRGNRYAITDVVKDDLSPYVLLKLADASSLSTIGFGASEDTRSGDQVFVGTNPNSLVSTTVQNSEFPVLVEPTKAEEFATAWSLAGASSMGPVFSTSGDLLAFVDAKQTATPIDHALNFVQAVIRNAEPSQAAMGIYTLDLSHVYNLDPALRQGLSTGALVIAPTGKTAVPTAGPAASAGLLSHDIITAIDGQAITPETSLAELLTTYAPGETIKLNIVRAGGPLEINLTLGDFKALVY